MRNWQKKTIDKKLGMDNNPLNWKKKLGEENQSWVTWKKNSKPKEEKERKTSEENRH